ncbi:MAG: ABC transporter permease [Proteobacteria bacterium]|nr:ABC transporter permease [Pseudomonadota bacterium]
MKLLRPVLVILFLLLAWQMIVYVGHLPFYILPGPYKVIDSLFINKNLILNNLWPTLFEIIVGLLIGSIAGVCTAIALSYFDWSRPWILPLLIISQALPIFAIAPLLVIWFGYGSVSKVVVTTIMIFFPVASSFYDGLRRTPKDWLDLAQVMGASPWRLIWSIKIPAALPALGSGLRVAATFAPMGAIIGEWVGSSQGLGFLMINANARMQIDLLFSTLIILIILTLLLYFTVDLFFKKIIFWSNDVE